jgi:anti-sigma factor RsiW
VNTERGRDVFEECPEIELLAAYADQNLTPAEQGWMEGHFAECDICRETLLTTLKSKAASEAPGRSPRPTDLSDA